MPSSLVPVDHDPFAQDQLVSPAGKIVRGGRANLMSSRIFDDAPAQTLSDDGVYVPGGAEHYRNFRRSENIEDRRDESLWEKFKAYADGVARFPELSEFKEMLRHPMTQYHHPSGAIPPLSPLAEDLGAGSIGKANVRLVPVDHDPFSQQPEPAQ